MKSEVLPSVKLQSSKSRYLCFLTGDEEEIFNIDEPESIPFDIIWDTGCCEHVADRADLLNYTVEESVGSRKGKNYNDASGNPLLNEGEVCAHLIGRDEHGKKEALRSIFQVVKVQRPLWSISRMRDNIEDEDAEVIFKRKEAFVRNSKGKILARAERRGGLYVGTYALRNPKHPGFHRPER